MDDHCRRFTERVMMDSFKKLLTNSAVYSWSLEIHQGIVTMLELFVDLLLARMPHTPVPCEWLNHILAPVSWYCEERVGIEERDGQFFQYIVVSFSSRS